MSEAKGNNKNAESKGKGNLLKIVIIVLLALILIGGTAFGTYFLLKSRNNAEGSTKKEVEITPTMFSLDEFLVNLADEKGRRYLKVKIFIGYEENEELAKELEQKKTILRDAVNSILRSKKSDEVSQSGEEQLKTELLIKVNSHLTNGKARDIYFHDILIQ